MVLTKMWLVVVYCSERVCVCLWVSLCDWHRDGGESAAMCAQSHVAAAANVLSGVLDVVPLHSFKLVVTIDFWPLDTCEPP